VVVADVRFTAYEGRGENRRDGCSLDSNVLGIGFATDSRGCSRLMCLGSGTCWLGRNWDEWWN
jgi:hypothetical protein